MSRLKSNVAAKAPGALSSARIHTVWSGRRRKNIGQFHNRSCRVCLSQSVATVRRGRLTRIFHTLQKTQRHLIWGARSSRVLVWASRQNELHPAEPSVGARRHWPGGCGKFVSTGRRDFSGACNVRTPIPFLSFNHARPAGDGRLALLSAAAWPSASSSSPQAWRPRRKFRRFIFPGPRRGRGRFSRSARWRGRAAERWPFRGPGNRGRGGSRRVARR